MVLTFTFVLPITLETIRTFTAIILRITDTTSPQLKFQILQAFFCQKQERILLIIWKL
jgi:hypothetical protein